MTSRKAKKPREERPSAVVIAFPVIARRDLDAGAKLPFPVVPVHPSEHVSSKAAPEAANENDRPTLPEPQRGRWWETAIALSILAHAVLFFALWERNNYDLERAAGAAAASNDGTIVIPIEVLVSAALPSAQKPVEATTPDEKQVTNTPPQAQQENKKQEKTDTAPPQKNDEAPEVVQTAKESPKPEKEKQDQKKKETSAASQTAAANPSQAAASRAQGRAGAGGRLESGGTANSSAYQAQVLAHLQRFRSYPAEAKAAGIRGTAPVRFSLSSSGAVISASLAHGSGASVLDQAAIAVVRRASPFPPIPANLGRSRLDFAGPIRFDLR